VLWGIVFGFIISSYLSYSFIFSTSILDLKLSAMTIDDLWRIVEGLAVIVGGTGIGGLIGSFIEEKQSDRNFTIRNNKDLDE